MPHDTLRLVRGSIRPKYPLLMLLAASYAGLHGVLAAIEGPRKGIGATVPRVGGDDRLSRFRFDF